MNFKIKDLSHSDRPREKMLKNGPDYLTDSEILAIILGHGGKDISAIGLSQQLLSKFENIENLSKADTATLSNIKNIGIAKACALKSAFELGIRLRNWKEAEKIKIKSPENVYMLMKNKTYGKQVEHLYLISLNSRNQIINTDLITIGTVNETLISPREIIKRALFRNAVFTILVHNHPSNDTNPSDEDIAITHKVFDSCKLVGVPLIDHIIVSDHGFTSLKALNLLNKGGD